MKLNLSIGLLMCLLCPSGIAADFDGDGVADEFTITRDSAKAAKVSGVRLANPWEEIRADKEPPKGLGFIIRLSREARTYLVNDASFFNGPMWLENKPEVFMQIITKKDRRYRDWKKQVPALKADAIQFGTEGGARHPALLDRQTMAPLLAGCGRSEKPRRASKEDTNMTKEFQARCEVTMTFTDGENPPKIRTSEPSKASVTN